MKTTANMNTLTTLHNLYFSEKKPAELQPLDIALATYLVLRQTDDHFIFDSQDTLATRLGCERKAIARSISRLTAARWITTKDPFQWSEKTKTKTRNVAQTSGLSINLDKLPHVGDRAKRAPAPSEQAIELAKNHTEFLVQQTKQGVKRFHKNFQRQQEHAAQRLIDESENVTVVCEIVNFAIADKRFSKAALKSLYEVRLRWKMTRKAFDEMKAKTPA